MYSRSSHGAGSTPRYSAKNNLRPTNFVCYAPEAKHVSLIGEFNEWHPNTHHMKRQPDGAWTVQIQLGHGHHHYLFYVDGTERLDPRAHGIVQNEKKERVSLIAVS